jgi:hypothetical protein
VVSRGCGPNAASELGPKRPVTPLVACATSRVDLLVARLAAAGLHRRDLRRNALDERGQEGRVCQHCKAKLRW